MYTFKKKKRKSFTKRINKTKSAKVRVLLLCTGLLITSFLVSSLAFLLAHDYKTAGETYSPYAVAVSDEYFEQEVEKNKDITAWEEPQQPIYPTVQSKNNQKIEAIRTIGKVNDLNVIETANIGSINTFDNVEGDITTEGINNPMASEISSLNIGGKGFGLADSINSVINQVTDTSQASSNTGIYEVQAGDNLWTIAQTQLGDGDLWTQISSLNTDIVSADTGWVIVPGMILSLPN